MPNSSAANESAWLALTELVGVSPISHWLRSVPKPAMHYFFAGAVTTIVIGWLGTVTSVLARWLDFGSLLKGT